MQIILILHSLVRWLILIFGLLAVVKAIGGLSSNSLYSSADNRNSLLFMIFCDIQFLIGLALYFGNTWFDQLKVPSNMKVAGIRFFTVEHSVMMILAWMLVHIGRSAVKKTIGDRAKHKKTVIYFGLALLLILAAIPWPFREAVARPLFRWF